MASRDSRLYLKSLKLEGEEALYSPSAAKKMSAVPAASSKALAPGGTLRDQMIKLREQTLQCTLCSELAATRKKVVFGSGNLETRVVFVGEAPGQEEDIQGLPFVGAAGQLLTKIIEAVGLKREQVFIANVLKCRPPANRQPKPEEVANCEPYLRRQIDLINPKWVVALGTHAAQTLLKSKTPVSALRGRFHEQAGYKILCTYHPAYLLRNPGEKRSVWEDMKLLKRDMERENG